MTAKKEMIELRKKDSPSLLAELAKEKNQLSKDAIALKLGKFSKTHEVYARRRRIARILTALQDKLSQVKADSGKKGSS